MLVDVRYSVFLTLDIPEEKLEAATHMESFEERARAFQKLIAEADPAIEAFMRDHDNELCGITDTEGYIYYEA